MRKNFVAIVLLVLAVGLVSGCATAAAPVNGSLFLSVKHPGDNANNDSGWSKMGSSSCMSILGIVGLGDASMTTAITGGGLSKVHHVDFESKAILGIFATYTTVVYGD